MPPSVSASPKLSAQPPRGGASPWREKFRALRSLPPFLRLVWETHSGYATAIVLLRLLRATIPIATLWIAKLIIDSVVAARMGRPSISRLWLLVGLELIVVSVGEALDKASTAVEGLFGDLCSNHISEKLIAHAAALDLRHFEDPAFYDQLERAQRQTTGRIGLLTQLLSVGQDFVTLVSLAVAVYVYGPWLLALLVAAVLPGFLGETHFSSLEYSLLYRMTPERRQLDYLRFLSAGDKTAKEVQMFGLSQWLVSRYRKLARRFYEANRSLAIRKGIAATLLSLLGIVGYYAAYVIILRRGFYGIITIGTLTFLAASFARSRSVTERLLLSAGNIYEQSLYIQDLFDFFKMQPSIVSPPGASAVPVPISQGLVFEDVGFQYPGSDTWAVRHVNLRIAPGENIALVGENGAGKTTLAKLLARLYDPTEGRILLDGVDLRKYELPSVRRAIGVIFQDFVHYDFRLDENIGIGEISQVQEYLDCMAEPSANEPGGNFTSHNAIVAAAEKSQAAALAHNLPFGYRQMLGRRFEGGIELSGGEWQKIALARAYIRNAQVVILDEPTAALDARAEYETFARFAELVSGQMALLISHRFSTVRMASRILVLQQGAITEEGTHEELVSRNGLYAELFRLQAEGYR
ncbi:MAG TPA: ABC transporter ATP-binding protein [Candidatus Dormibacteraeota bacterium]|nr:ABC transporter ATP-binding protein [Candidatus Dormibacteraeota bacterium]